MIPKNHRGDAENAEKTDMNGSTKKTIGVSIEIGFSR